MTEKLFTGTLNHNQNKTKNVCIEAMIYDQDKCNVFLDGVPFHNPGENSRFHFRKKHIIDSMMTSGCRLYGNTDYSNEYMNY